MIGRQYCRYCGKHKHIENGAYVITANRQQYFKCAACVECMKAKRA